MEFKKFPLTLEPVDGDKCWVLITSNLLAHGEVLLLVLLLVLTVLELALLSNSNFPGTEVCLITLGVPIGEKQNI